MEFIKNILRKINPYKTKPASEVFAGRPLVRSNVPGEYMLSGVSERHRKMTDSEYREKIFRKENNIRNSMDILEDKVLNCARTIISDYYNHPHKIIAGMQKNKNYVEKLNILNELINAILSESEQMKFEYKERHDYQKYTVSSLDFIKRSEKKIEELIYILTEEKDLLKETISYEVYDETLKRLKEVNSNICRIQSKQNWVIEERIEFWGD